MEISYLWLGLILGSAATLLAVWLMAFVLSNSKARTAISYFAPLVVIAVCLVFGRHWPAYGRLAISCLTLLYTFKGASLLRLPIEKVRSAPRFGILYFSTVWPGIDPCPFLQPRVPTIEDHRRFAGGVGRAILGVIAFLLVAGFLPSFSANTSTWIAVFAILLAAHLGFTSALSEITRALGWPVPLLFDSPHRSTSLSNFWSHRWNRPFVEMNRIFFMPWLARKFGLRIAIFGVFMISGFLHELAISFPAQSGWGGPLLYFAIQGLLVLAERKLPFRGPLWVALVVLTPLPILFHQAFRSEIVLPYLTLTHDFLTSIGIHRAASWLVSILGVAQLLVLAASFQVPTRLRWKEELPRLSSLNHKLMWIYGSFVVFTILSWASLTLLLRGDILTGTRPGIALCVVISLFWLFRLAVDTFYFRSTDWPEGPFMQIGHVLLNYLFAFVLIGYSLLLMGQIIGVLS